MYNELKEFAESFGLDTTCRLHRHSQIRPLPLRQTLHQDCRQSYYRLRTYPAEVNRLNAYYKFCPLMDSDSLCLPVFCLTVTMQGQMATVHRFISPTSCGSFATTCV